MSRRVAAIDCGTNSIRLLIADYDDNSITDVTERKVRINRLGHGVDKTGLLNKDALERTFDFEREFAKDLQEFGVLPENTRFVATSATRDASNREEFFNKTHEILGIYPEVISGEEEAALSFAGVISALDKTSQTHLVVDLGGGSTELIVGANTPKSSFSMNIGSVRITERHFAGVSDDAQIPRELIELAKTDINRAIDECFSELAMRGASIHEVDNIIGVAGTVTTVTAYALGLVEYDPLKISGTKLGLETIVETCDNILADTKSTIRNYPFINPGRVAVIQAGCLIWKTLLLRIVKAWQASDKQLITATTSEHDILDGIALGIGIKA